MRKETTQQLDAFREQQREAERTAVQPDASPEAESAETWTTGPRKRKKGRESTIGGVKLRRVSTSEKQAPSPTATKISEPERPTDESAAVATKEDMKATQTTSNKSQEEPADGSDAQSPEVKKKENDSPKSPSPAAAGLGLVAYSSDEDEDD